MLAAAGISAASSLYGAYKNSQANDEQASAAAQAQASQEALMRDRMAAMSQAATGANALVGQGAQQGQNQLQQAMAAGQGYLQQGFGQGRNDLMAGERTALGRLNAGVAGARSDLLQGQGGIESALQGGLNSAQGTLQGAANNSRLAGLMNGGLQAGFQTDPGYGFRQQQGEQAINRGAAAAGGRVSTASLKSLANFNSGLAQQGYNDYANRAIGMAGQEDSRQAQLMGNLAQMQYGSGGQLAQARGTLAGNLAQGQMQGGMTGAGYGMNLGSGLSNLATGQGGALANLQMQGGNNLAQMMYGAGQQQGANLLSGAGATIGLASNMMGQYNNPVGYAGAGTAAMGQGYANALAGLGQGALGQYMYGQGNQVPDWTDAQRNGAGQYNDWGGSGSNY
jgi:hypothetical protein